jgi:diguanylate cyclase (GGDEF)-like protein
VGTFLVPTLEHGGHKTVPTLPRSTDVNERTSTLRSKITKLREVFVAQFPERLSEARRCLGALQANPCDHDAAIELHRILHSIKGTGNSFGFKPVAAAAGEGEHLVAQLVESKTASATVLRELNDILAAVERASLSMQSADVSHIQTGLSPAYEIKPAIAALPEAGNEKLVYICDDDVMQAKLLMDQLLCFGYHPRIFGNTADLLQAVEHQIPAAAIMDIMFPEGASAGTNVLSVLRDKGMQFPAIFISGRNDFDARLNAIQAGGVAYFAKPIKPMDMVASLDLLTRKIEPEPFKVLVIDDEQGIAEYHQLILESAGMIVQTIQEPAEVLERVSNFRPDLVLMDMYMPKCTGREVAKLIRQIPDFVSLPIIYLSSETDREKQFSAMRVGADGFLTKPIQTEELITSVELRAERMRTLRSLMARDSLTGLFNHTTTTQLLESAIVAARRENAPLSFAMIDLDRFKSINDTYGHPVGDQVILALARVLRQRLRNSDLVGRYGGEEFAVILPGIAQDGAKQIMDQLRADFSHVLFHAGEINFSSTFSCGIAGYPDFDDMETMREAADKALYQAKHQGRNTVVTHAK